MSASGRAKKRAQLWEKRSFHFSLCFVVGFFTGLTPSNDPAISSTHLVSYQEETLHFSPNPFPNLQTKIQTEAPPPPPPPPPPAALDLEQPSSQRLLIVITTTRSGDRSEPALLQRLARTLRSVAPPLLWIVVEAHADAPRTAGMLRRTGILYRHLTFSENFTDPESGVHHQRNVALSHIEHHRIGGIVHFADVSNVYDLRFFDDIRGIEAFGVWPVALLSANKKPEVRVEGPVCRSSKVLGWHAKDVDSNIIYDQKVLRSAAIGAWSFAFNSSVLWDPERWGRPISLPDTSQDSMRFVEQVIVEDETKLKAIPSDCSRVMVWRLHSD